MYVSLLDRLLYRRPFEGGSARRYAYDERPAFGDLDDRLLDDLAPELEMLIASADSRLAAISNDVRVRVEFSKNRLITVRPRSEASFLTGSLASAQ